MSLSFDLSRLHPAAPDLSFDTSRLPTPPEPRIYPTTGQPRRSRTSFKDLTSKRFGRWFVLAEAPMMHLSQTRWHCRCDCGTLKTVIGANLSKGVTRSCGCLRKETLAKPDDTVHSQRNPTYRSWQNMRTICLNKNHPSYPIHGGKGETICLTWLNNFDQFLADMGPRPAGASLVSMDGRRWSKGTCEWKVK